MNGKKLLKMGFALLALGLFSCTNATNSSNIETIPEEGETMEKIMLSLKIDEETVDVTWENNPSAKGLSRLASNGLRIDMRMYGGFEQVGLLGTSLPSNDVQMTTSPGDIVLYSGNQIVVFYGSNTWDYTKLGHINLSREKLEDLLGKKPVSLYISKN